MKRGKFVLYDISLYFLLLSNIITIYIAVMEQWDIRTVFAVFWLQSVIIGLFNVLRILQLKNYSTGGLKLNGRLLSAIPETKKKVAGFFALHYGFFHFGYAIFIFSSGDGVRVNGQAVNPETYLGGGVIDFRFLFLIGLLFFANHTFSYFYNRHKDFSSQKKVNLSHITFIPYVRILPIHLTLGIAATSAGATIPLVVFLSVKTVADLMGHIVEHGLYKYPK